MNKFAGIGEVLWDVLPEGRTLGGAPANFAFHARNLGGAGYVVSRIGADELGHEALGLLERGGVDVSCIATDPQRPTGTVLAELDRQGKASYRFPPEVAWDALMPEEHCLALAPLLDGVCFGSLGQRAEESRRGIRAFLEATRPDGLRVFDVNLRQDFYSRPVLRDSLELASVLKLSDEELPVLATMFDLAGSDTEQLAALVARFDLRLVALTLGKAGSLLATSGETHRKPGRSATLVDTIGAGDSFTAALTLGMAAGWPLAKINKRANDVAAAVCGQSGGMVAVPKSLRIF